MKKIVIFIVLAVVMFSCTNEDYLLYDAEAKNKLSFAQDTVLFNYGFEVDKDVDVAISLNLIGFVSKDKTLDINIITTDGSDAIEGTDYVIANKSIMPDTAAALIKLDFKKSNLTINRLYKLVLEVKENDNFTPTNKRRCIVLFGNNDMEQPKWWKPEMLGTYTQEKHVLFVNNFWTTKELSPIIYNTISVTNKFGHNLDGTYTRWESDMSYTLLTIAAYVDFFKRYVRIPMYEYYLKTNDPKYQIPNPGI